MTTRADNRASQHTGPLRCLRTPDLYDREERRLQRIALGGFVW
jgi:hypothetical protein